MHYCKKSRKLKGTKYLHFLLVLVTVSLLVAPCLASFKKDYNSRQDQLRKTPHTDNSDYRNAIFRTVQPDQSRTPEASEALNKLAAIDITPPTITCPPDPAPIEGCSATDVQRKSNLPYSTTEITITEEEFKKEGGIVRASNITITYQDSETSAPVQPIVRVVTRTFTAIDALGKTTSCMQTFTIQDTQPPTITSCPPDLLVPGTGTDDITNGGFTTLEFSNRSLVSKNTFNAEGGAFNDNCIPHSSITYEDSSSDTCPTVVTRTWTVRDLGNNIATCVQKIILVDDEPPTAVCQDISVQLDGTGNVSITPEQIDDGSFDNCGIADLSLDRTDFTTADLGSNIVTLTATDTNGNTATCTAQLTVEQGVPAVNSVTGFVLVDADSDADLFPITPGMVIDVNTLATNLNIRADATSDVESVALVLSGAESYSRTENIAPYALYGDNTSTGDYLPHVFALGNYSLTATPYSGDNLSGTQGTGLTVNFEFTNTCDSLDPFVSDAIHPTSCGGREGIIEIGAPTANPPVTFIWSHDPNLNGYIATGLSAGTYTIEVLDASNCTVTLQVELSDPDLPIVGMANFFDVLDTDAPFELTGGSPTGGTYSGPGVSDGMFHPMEVGAGTYEITYTYTDGNGCSNSTTESITVLSTSSGLAINQFVLVDADTNLDIMTINFGSAIDMATLPTRNLNIRADATADVESVELSLSLTQSNTRTENVPPYALFGDSPSGDYLAHAFDVGVYELNAIPYSGDNLSGTRGVAKNIRFAVGEGTDIPKKQSNKMRVYPNPASTQITVSFKKPVEIQTIEVFDMMGRLVRTYESGEVRNGQGYSLELSSMPPGMYVLRAVDEKGFQSQKQMVIKH